MTFNMQPELQYHGFQICSLFLDDLCSNLTELFAKGTKNESFLLCCVQIRKKLERF